MTPAHELVLSGVTPAPLASYLTGLGVLRIVSAQIDAQAKGHWAHDRFILTTTLPEEELLGFFLDAYSPTPVVSPWNGGSGFGEKDNVDGLSAILGSTSDRLSDYRETIEQVQTMPRSDALDKARYVQSLRNVLPERALDWLDAAVVLADGEPVFPILLGTGGNDGRLDFSNNLMQHLATVLRLRTGKAAPTRAHSDAWLRSVLFGDVAVTAVAASAGQFSPGAVGGPNSAPSGAGKGLVNPWSFVLMIEGAMVFAAAAVRRRGDPKQAVSAPFTFMSAPTGYGSAADEKGRGEIWAPLWDQPMSASSLASLFADARMIWQGRAARRSEHAVRSLAKLQHDRRITSFVRYSIAERNGQANSAVPVSRLRAPHDARREVDLLAGVDAWLDGVRRLGDGTTPMLGSAVRACEELMYGVAQRAGSSDRLVGLLSAVANVESIVGRSPRYRGEVGPVRGLPASEWIAAMGSIMSGIEARLARAIASARDVGDDDPTSSLRAILCGVDTRRRMPDWLDRPPLVPRELGGITRRLALAAVHRDHRAAWVTDDQGRRTRSLACTSGWTVARDDRIAWATGRYDRHRLDELTTAFMILDWSSSRSRVAAVAWSPDGDLPIDGGPGVSDDRLGCGSAPNQGSSDDDDDVDDHDDHDVDDHGNDDNTIDDEVTASVRGEADEARRRSPDSRPLPALAAAVLLHGGRPAVLAVPPGLPRQLISAMGQACASMSRSLRIAGYEPALTVLATVDGDALAAALLLRARKGTAGRDRAALLDAAGLISPERARADRLAGDPVA